MLCSRLLYLWEAPTVWRVVLWKRGRGWWRRVWQRSLYPGPWKEMRRTERVWGYHSAPKHWRGSYPLMSYVGWLWDFEWFLTTALPYYKTALFFWVTSLRYRPAWCCVLVMSQNLYCCSEKLGVTQIWQIKEKPGINIRRHSILNHSLISTNKRMLSIVPINMNEWYIQA